MKIESIDVPMPILTPRLRIRPPAPGDGRAHHEAVAETIDDLRPWLPWTRRELGVADSEAGCLAAQDLFRKREDLRVFLFDRASGELVGGSGLHRVNWEHRLFEIGYWVRKSRAGRGYATEAANALARYAFGALGARRVAIHCNASNAASRAVAERLGFPLEGVLRNEDVVAAPEVACRDHAVYARVSAEGLPPLEVIW